MMITMKESNLVSHLSCVFLVWLGIWVHNWDARFFNYFLNFNQLLGGIQKTCIPTNVCPRALVCPLLLFANIFRLKILRRWFVANLIWSGKNSSNLPLKGMPIIFQASCWGDPIYRRRGLFRCNIIYLLFTRDPGREKQKLGCNARSSKINNRFDTRHHGVKVNMMFLLLDICTSKKVQELLKPNYFKKQCSSSSFLLNWGR